MKKFFHRLFDHYANVNQKTRFRTLCLFWSVILALSILSGCMWIPANQHASKPSQLYDKTSTVTFAGALITPNAEVTIQAYDPQAKTWDDMAKTTSVDYIWPTGSGRYNWTVHKVVPNQYWARDQECASAGESALVRSKWDGGDLASLAVPDMWQCRAEYPDDADFIANCKAPESPNVLLPSLDYRNLGRECADTINRIRSKEGKPPLQIDEAWECDADSEAKCNYEAGVPHTCMNSTQNECWTAGSIDEITDACIWDYMYEKEKTCYEKNPPSDPCGFAQDGCYNDENCRCGHYVNMVVCPKYTKVSCGLYEVKDNSGNWQFHSVQNFK